MLVIIAAIFAPMIQRLRHVRDWRRIEEKYGFETLDISWSTYYEGEPGEGERIYMSPNGLARRTGLYAFLDWVSPKLAKDCFSGVEQVRVERKVSTSDRKQLGRLLRDSPNLVELTWVGECDEEIAVSIGKIRKLNILLLSETDTDLIVKHIADSDLPMLLLDRCKISAEGIISLKRMKSLKLLLFSDARVDANAIASLRTSLPNCFVLDASLREE